MTVTIPTCDITKHYDRGRVYRWKTAEVVSEALKGPATVYAEVSIGHDKLRKRLVATLRTVTNNAYGDLRELYGALVLATLDLERFTVKQLEAFTTEVLDDHLPRLLTADGPDGARARAILPT